MGERTEHKDLGDPDPLFSGIEIPALEALLDQAERLAENFGEFKRRIRDERDRRRQKV
ncbi:MAG: hypothetical protein Greene07147_14 [Parcubacteria group bacterium Greene0714_7]|nr:MAG: hypothetical protein Greene07147_14 [Parcubacteria group bacterium Greene0714_7]